MKTLYILRGLPASGKSTWRKEKGYPYVNKDEIRKALPNAKEHEIHSHQMEALEHLATVIGHPEIVIDNCNLNPKTVAQYKQFAAKHGYTVQEKWFHVSVESAITRDMYRTDKVGSHVICGMAMQYDMLPDRECFIFDIDGTLANPDHRKHLLPHNGGSWDAFFEAQYLDPVYTDRRLVLNILAQRYQIFLVSGRPDTYRKMTEEWLREKGIQYKALFMRKAKDTRPDDIIKKEIYMRYFKTMDVKAVYDDRNSVCLMWRSLGLNCYQVQEGNF